jgi:hypothetical protein
MGAGHFSQKLSLEDWMTFANAQRAHYNYIGQTNEKMKIRP